MKSSKTNVSEQEMEVKVVEEPQHTKLVKILWIDSGLTIDLGVWYKRKELIKESKDSLSLVASVGYLIYEDKEHVVISSSSDGDLFRGGFRILKSCIVKKEVIEETDITEELEETQKKVLDFETKKNNFIENSKKRKKIASKRKKATKKNTKKRK